MKLVRGLLSAETLCEKTFMIGDCEIPDATLILLEKELAQYSSPDEAFAMIGPRGLEAILGETAPDLINQLEQGRQKLNQDPGYCVIKKTGLEIVDGPLAQLGAIALSCLYGTPTRTTPHSPVIAWPIANKPESKNARKTFSETNSEASFHTDSQYIENPEQYFGLFCIKPDRRGGGVSQVVDGLSIVNQLRETHGRAILDELAKPYPFRLPSIFTKSPEDQEAEMVWAPIFSQGVIRYRYDTLMNALKVDGIAISDEQREAINAFEEALQNAIADEYSLEAGDVMFVNNYRMLHGRTAFDDDQRLLYRVRMG